MSYKHMFESVQAWMPYIISDIKRDVKKEHLARDEHFCKKYFITLHSTPEELAHAYYTDITTGNSGLGEFIASRWVFKHADVYDLFVSYIRKVREDFETLEEIPLHISHELIECSNQRFGVVKTYLFAVLNQVKFPSCLFEALRMKAKAISMRNKEEHDALATIGFSEASYEQLSGLERKYVKDTLKKRS